MRRNMAIQKGGIMKKNDPNYIVKVEKAIAEKYGQEAIDNPKRHWTNEKEKQYVKQLKDLYAFVKDWNSNGKNLVLVTHYSIITAATNAVPSSGELVITDKNFEVLGTIKTD